MTKIFTLNDIKSVIKPKKIIQVVEEGFSLYAKKLAVIAPLSSLNIGKKGLAKIKYGYIKDNDFFVIKVGSFFPENIKKNIPTINASLQIYSQETGEFAALLLDEAYLTNIRTAAAGAIVAKYFKPKRISKIGILGTGVQAKFQLEYLRQLIPCKNVIVWGRHYQHAKKFQLDMESAGFNIEAKKNITDLTSQCNLIISATSATSPILFGDQVLPGTLIISIGADTQDKHEIDDTLLKKADLVIADSKVQCAHLGNIAHALQTHTLQEDSILELGDAILENIKRKNDQQLIVANLTGVAIQDIQVANFVYQALLNKSSHYEIS